MTRNTIIVGAYSAAIALAMSDGVSQGAPDMANAPSPEPLIETRQVRRARERREANGVGR